MDRKQVSRTSVAAALDVLLFVLGLAVLLFVLVEYLQEDVDAGWVGLIAVAMIVVMSRFPLTIPRDAGDLVIGFETCVLVFLVLTQDSPAEALVLWSVGTTIANLTQRKSWRTRMFNVGITILSGALLVGIFALLDPPTDPGDVWHLIAVLVACAAFFLFDLFVTAASLAIEDGSSLREVISWNSLALGLATFVSVDTLGFLAALLYFSDPYWSLLLLLVPIGTILVAVRSVGSARLAHLRLEGLLEAATNAHDWADDEQIERSLVAQAAKTLRHTHAELRDEPAGLGEISAAIEIPGRPVRHLVVAHHSSNRTFDDRDKAALEALTAVGVSAYNRRRMHDEMTYLARHDALTGLHNRSVFTERLAEALERHEGTGLVGVLYCDLDGFKEVNDLLGHAVGDRLLAHAAERIMRGIREDDTAARLGGDEFGILLESLATPAQAEVIAARLLESLGEPFPLDDTEVRVRSSIGIAFNLEPSESAEVLINSADTAMYVAKAKGKGRVEVFHPDMRAAELDRLELEAALRDAVADDRIGVHFQPLVDLRSGQIDGFEALARWHHPALGHVPPDVFIAAAERIGVIRQLGQQILERAHSGGVTLARAAGRPVSLSVNLSALQVTDEGFAERVHELQRNHPEVGLVLELTEGIMLSNDPATVAAIERLKGDGLRMAIDDFGVGYSSVGYLHRLPVDILKVDKVFVSDLHDPRSHALVEGVVSMANALSLDVVVEGVEDWSSARAMRDLGCQYGQGYLFSRPVPLVEALELARAGAVDVAPMSVEPSGPSAQAEPRLLRAQARSNR